MRSLPIIGCLLFLTSWILAQDREVLPVSIHQYFQHIDMINPAATAYQYKRKAILGNTSLDGIFNEVQTNFVGASMRFGSKDSTNQDAHGIGLSLLTAREGPYISKSRFLASYGWHNSIHKNWMLSLGLMAGFINYLYKETDILPGQSALKFTSDVGVFLYQPQKIAIGLSLNQYIRSDMAPLEPGLLVKPYVTLILDYTVRVSYLLDWRNSFFCRGPIQKNKLYTNITSALIIQKMVVAGLQYKIHKGYSFLVGLESGPRRRNGVNLYFSYYTPFLLKDNIRVSEAELTLSFFKF